MLEEMKFVQFSTAGNTPSYNYLLNMPLYSLTTDTLADLKKQEEDKQSTLSTLANQTIENLWLYDLKEFQDKYASHVEKLNTVSKKQLKMDVSNKKRKRRSPEKKTSKPVENAILVN